MTEPPAGCRLYAVVEAGEAAGDRLAAALAAADLAAALIAPAAGQRLQKAATQPLVAQARQAGVTALVLADAQLARAAGADGVHLPAGDDPQALYGAARNAIGKDGIVGVDAGISRHAAMTLAETGADYVGFGAPAHLKDRDKARARREELVSWWAAIFEVPCVAFDVETPEEARQLAAAGADFIAVTLPVTMPASAVHDLVKSLADAILASQSSPQPSPQSSP